MQLYVKLVLVREAMAINKGAKGKTETTQKRKNMKMVVLVKIPQVPVPAGSGQLPLSFFSSWRRVLVYFHFTSKEEKENYYAHTLKVILATMVALPPT